MRDLLALVILWAWYFNTWPVLPVKVVEAPRELRCYQGCVETYRADGTDDAGMRLADCTDRCEGE